MPTKQTNIRSIATDCTGCGICSTVCPQACIDYTFSEREGMFLPTVDDQRCISCGKCLKVCPTVIRSMDDEEPPFIGHYEAVYAAHSQDRQLRKAAASGGFITAFLCYMLRQGHADGVLLTKRTGVTGQSFLATTTEEIMASKTSVYAPVDYAAGIRKLMATDHKKIIVVGLPCHIQAVHHLRHINPTVDSKIVLTISILCGKTPTTHAYRYIAEKQHFDYDSIKTISNRGDGWPGDMRIAHDHGEYRIPYRANMSMGMVLSSPWMCNTGCLSCLDGIGLTADMVVCDAWNKKYTQMKSDGWNYVLVKTKAAMALIGQENLDHDIHLEKESIENFIAANKRVIEKAKTGVSLRQPENKPQNIHRPLTMKQHLYSAVMRWYKNHHQNFDYRLKGRLLLLGKVLNKLKE